MTDLTPNIAQNATAPKSAETDGLRVEQQPLPDQIDADAYLKDQQAATRSQLPIRFAKLRPDAAV